MKVVIFFPSVFVIQFPATEVESIVEAEVRSVIEERGYSSHHRIIVVSKLIGALESDAAWVDMYGVTGELIVPDVFKEDDVIGELLKESQKVRVL